MSGIEILGIASSVIQIADMGARLSVKLYTFTRKAKNSDRSIKEISQEIASTGVALRELGEVLGEDRFASLGSQQSINSAGQIAADSRKIFADINKAIGGRNLMQAVQSHGSDKLTSLKFPFIESQIAMLRASKASLSLRPNCNLQTVSCTRNLRTRSRNDGCKYTRSLTNDRIDPANADSDQDKVNPRIRIRQLEIEDHTALVSKILQDISDVQYRMDHGIRDKMQKGVLRTHWDEWPPLAERYGDQVFMKTFNARSHVLRYWLDQDDLQAGGKGGKKEQREEAFESKVRDQFMNASYLTDYVGRKIREKRDRSRTIDLSRPTYIKVNRKYLSPDTLDTYPLPWEWDMEYIDEDFQDVLFSHTKALKEQKLITSGYEKEVEGMHDASEISAYQEDRVCLDESDVDVVEEKEDDVVEVYPSDSLSVVERTEKPQDRMHLAREKTRSPMRRNDEVEDLLSQWTGLTKDEVFKAGLGSRDIRSSWMFM